MTLKFKNKLLIVSIFLIPLSSVAGDLLWCSGGNINFCTDKKIIDMFTGLKKNEQKFDKIKLKKEIIKYEQKNIKVNSKKLNFSMNNYGLADEKTIALWNNLAKKHLLGTSNKKNHIANKLVAGLIISPPNIRDKDESENNQKWLNSFLEDLRKNYGITYEYPEDSITKKKLFDLTIANAVGNHIFLDFELDRKTFFSIWVKLQNLYQTLKKRHPKDFINKNHPSKELIESSLDNEFERRIYNESKRLEKYFIENSPNDFLKSLNKNLEDIITREINRNIDLHKINIDKAKKFLKSYNNFTTLFTKKHPAIGHETFKKWKDKTTLDFHSKLERSVRIFQDGKKSPRVDRIVGNLFLNNNHYFELKSKGLLKYLMMHEAIHVEENSVKAFSDGYKSLQSVIPDFFKLVKILDFENEIDDIKNETKTVQKELATLYEYFNKLNIKNEILVDIKALDQLSSGEKKKYLKMLEITLPPNQSFRLEILKGYINLVKRVESANFSKKNLVTTFIIRFLVHSALEKEFLDKAPDIYAVNREKSNYQYINFYKELYDFLFTLDTDYVAGSEVVSEGHGEIYSLITIKKILNDLPSFLKNNRTDETYETYVLFDIFSDLFETSDIIPFLNKLIDDQLKLSRALH